ncbi:MAG: SAM-dependent methyltransferase, partial [Prevotella sp.]|nr:SAM-dependent methyltransferase [Prevotella sp.]
FPAESVGFVGVRLESIEITAARGPVIHVLGADLMDGTPIFDIKPYVVYADSHPDARSGFVDRRSWPKLEVVVPDFVEKHFEKAEIEMLRQTLSLDPRPHYQNDPQKVYGMPFAGRDVRFRVADGVLTIVEIKV